MCKKNPQNDLKDNFNDIPGPSVGTHSGMIRKLKTRVCVEDSRARLMTPLHYTALLGNICD